MSGDEGNSEPADSLMYFKFFIFKFLLPPPSPYSQAQDPDGESLGVPGVEVVANQISFRRWLAGYKECPLSG